MVSRRVKKAEELPWKRVEGDFGDDIDLDDGLFYGLEEIDDVQVVKADGKVTYKILDDGHADSTKTPVAKAAENSTKLANAKKASSKKHATAIAETEEDSPSSPNLETFYASNDVTRSALYTVVDKLGSWPPLDSRLLSALNSLDFLEPTEIQAQVLPLALEGKDVIGKAATGSGKTLAFGLPLIQRSLLTEDESTLQGVIISPTRELAHQIKAHLDAIMDLTCPTTKSANVVCITGGLAIQKQLRLLALKPKIIVGTPGRLLEIISQMEPSMLKTMQAARSLILDEADRLVQTKNFQECERILGLIGHNRDRQVMVFSATFEPELWSNLSRNKIAKKEDIRELLRKKLSLKKSAEFVDVKKDLGVSKSVTEGVIECPGMQKDLYLYYFLQQFPAKTIVFVNSIDSVKRLVPLLKELQLSVVGIHSDMIQKQRLRSLEKFTAFEKGIIIATDVAARGLDIPAVDHVAHYHLPRSADTYVHRSGRTGRAGNEGVSVILCSPEEASGPLVKLRRLLSTRPVPLHVDYKVLERLRPRVELAKQIADTVSGSTRKGKLTSWIDKAADDLGIDLDDDERAKLEESSDRQKGGCAGDIRIMRDNLSRLLSKPLTSGSKYITHGSQSLASTTFHKVKSVDGFDTHTALNALRPNNKRRKMRN